MLIEPTSMPRNKSSFLPREIWTIMEFAYNGRAGLAIACNSKGYAPPGTASRPGFCPIG